MTEWRPIKTAPKDGRAILAAYRFGETTPKQYGGMGNLHKGIMLIQWSTILENLFTKEIHYGWTFQTGTFAKGQWTSGPLFLDTVFIELTHWMPEPAVPETEPEAVLVRCVP